MIPTLNQGRFLEQSLVSIIDQGHVGTELIVIDGGSDNDTVEILRRFDRHISYWVSGPIEARATPSTRASPSHRETSCAGRTPTTITSKARSRQSSRRSGAILMPASYTAIGWRSPKTDRRLRSVMHSTSLQGRFDTRATASSPKQCSGGGKSTIASAKFPVEFHQVMDNYMILRFALNEGPNAFVRVNRALGVFRQHEDQKTGHLGSVIVRREIAEMDERLGLTRRRGLVGFAVRLSLRMKRVVGYWRRGGFPYVFRFFTRFIRERG